MDAIFGALDLPLWIVLAAAATLAAFLYFGKRGGQIVGALAAAFVAIFAIRRDAQNDAKQDRLEQDLKNERDRQNNIRRADVAASRVRDTVGRDPDSLRNDDGFRRD